MRSYRNTERYINLLTDFGFRRLFDSESNKDLLIDFLNVVLPAEHRVKDVIHGNNEDVGNAAIAPNAIFHIYCEIESGERLIIEIQKVRYNYFKHRSAYYASFPIQEQAEKGSWNYKSRYKLSAVYTVGVLDFIFSEHCNDSTTMHVVELKNQHCEVFYDKLKFIYLELPKFTKTIDQLDNHFDKWLFLLKHLYKLEEQPQALQEEVFTRLFEVAEIAQFSPVERESYENSLKYYRDLKNVVDTSREEGREEGREVGREEGREEGIAIGKEATKEEIALNLLRENVSVEFISRTTGLSIATIQQIQARWQQE